MNPAGFVIHSVIHFGRPDVQCVLHTHTPDGIAVSVKANVEKLTRGLGGQIAWPALLRKLDRLDASYKS